MNLAAAIHLTPVDYIAAGILLCVYFVLFYFGAKFYGKSFALTKRGEGKIPMPHFGTPALVAALALFVFLMSIAIPELLNPQQTAVPDFSHLLKNLLRVIGLEVCVLIGAFAIWKWQHVKLREQLGLRLMKISRAIFTGVGLLALAYPLITIGSLIVYPFFGKGDKQEDAVRIVLNLLHHGNGWAIAIFVGFGVIVAPILEELIFRAFLYPILKQYIGFVGAMLLCAALFALIHTTPAALLPLFIFAILQTLAYERLGSILVPIATHATFNAVQFVLLAVSFKNIHGL